MTEQTGELYLCSNPASLNRSGGSQPGNARLATASGRIRRGNDKRSIGSRWFAALLCAMALPPPTAAGAAVSPDDCSLTFKGSYRAAVKLRPPNLSSYTDLGSGQPLTISQWIDQMHQLDPLVHQIPVTSTPAIQSVETQRVSLHGFLVGVKFERNETDSKADNDFHCEIAPSPDWDTDHVVVEVPPGQPYCDARKAIWKMVQQDALLTGKQLTDIDVLTHPVEIYVSGYVFLDGTHAKHGTTNFTDPKGKDAGRGIHGPDGTQQVRGLWEVHPVLAVKTSSPPFVPAPLAGQGNQSAAPTQTKVSTDQAPPNPVGTNPAVHATGWQTPAGSSSGVVAGKDLIVQMSGPFSGDPTVSFGGPDAEIASVDPKNNSLRVIVPSQLADGRYTLTVSLNGQPLPGKLMVGVKRLEWVYLVSLLAWGALLYLVYQLYQMRPRLPTAGPPQYGWLSTLLLEPENNTYSLSRFQFLCWFAALTFAALFIVLARGLVERVWDFPPFDGLPVPLLISLGTLVAAQATTSTAGPKGAGPVPPSPSDLVTHGGVLALDRVQQLVWTVLGSLGFLYVTLKTYGVAKAPPPIPDPLLTLMGISSVGYLAGKAARGPGPIIKKVTAGNGSLTISGEHLSTKGRVHVLLDGAEQPGGNVDIAEPEPGTADFVRSLTVKVPGVTPNWPAEKHTIKVVNDDGQFADWVFPLPPKLVTISPGAPDAQNRVTLTIRGENLIQGAELQVDKAPSGTQDANDPNLFTMMVGMDWLAADHVLQVKNPDGQSAVLLWTKRAAS